MEASCSFRWSQFLPILIYLYLCCLLSVAFRLSKKVCLLCFYHETLTFRSVRSLCFYSRSFQQMQGWSWSSCVCYEVELQGQSTIVVAGKGCWFRQTQTQTISKNNHPTRLLRRLSCHSFSSLHSRGQKGRRRLFSSDSICWLVTWLIFRKDFERKIFLQSLRCSRRRYETTSICCQQELHRTQQFEDYAVQERWKVKLIYRNF